MGQTSFARAAARFVALFVVAILLATVGLVSAAPPVPPSAAAQPKPTEKPAPIAIPCNPTAKRTLDKLVVGEGDTIRIRTEYSYNCTGKTRKVNFFLVIENTSYLRGPRDERLKNVKDGAIDFVNQVDFSNGSKGGMMLYAQDRTVRFPLQGDNGSGAVKDALLSQIRRISTEPIGDSSGAGKAIRDATGQLPTGVDSDTVNVLIIIDAGAPIIAEPLIKVGDACKAARDANVLTMVIGLRDAGSRLGGCATPGWFRYSSSDVGADVVGYFNEFATGLLRGLSADQDSYEDVQDSTWKYVDGSGNPRDPDLRLGTDYIWQFTAQPGRPVNRAVEYEVMAVEDQGEAIWPISVEAYVTLAFPGGLNRSLPVENPEVCIYSKRKPNFCDGFKANMTATAQALIGTATATTPPTAAPPTVPPTAAPPTDVAPTATDVPPTGVPPTDVPPTATSVPPTPTAVKTGSTVFLPVSMKGFEP